MITADEIKSWFAAQSLVYASATRPDNYHIRLTVSEFSDCPAYEVTRRHVVSMKTKQLYYGGDINAAVKIYNNEAY